MRIRSALPPILLAIAVTGLIAWSSGRSDAKNEKAEKTKAPAATAKAPSADAMKPAAERKGKVDKVVKTDEEWKEILTPDQYRVLRKKGTEMAFTGKYWNAHGHGVYRCAACGLELFSSDTKFNSGTGWPSFYRPIDPTHVDEIRDSTLGMVRIEVTCSRCGGHLGHVFDDGPKPTGLRYCINSAALDFVAQPTDEAKTAKSDSK